MMFPASPGSPGACGPGSPSSRSLDDLLTCPICLDSFADPRTLTCLHSFCAKCLESCKRPYRRDISCPICKKVTVLTPLGVQGLQNDFRIQQIRDILGSRPQSPPSGADGASVPEGKSCEVCKSQQKKAVATCHCIQCCMFFCAGCKAKHAANAVFAMHHVVNVSESVESLFCKQHKEQPVRYFCRSCTEMLCTVCMMEHDLSHSTETLDRAAVERQRQELRQSLKTLSSKLSDLCNRSKYLETVKQSQQRALCKAQGAIRERAEEVVHSIRCQEKQLLEGLQEHLEGWLKQTGTDRLSEMAFHKASMETLCKEMAEVLDGSPQLCLMQHEELMVRFKALADTPLPLTDHKAPSQQNVLKFMPSTDGICLIGSLRECSLEECESSDEECVILGSSPPSAATAFSSQPKAVPRRVTSILSALSPSRKTELKKAKIKSFSSDHAPTSPSTISADELISDSAESTSVTVKALPSSPSMLSSPPIAVTPNPPPSFRAVSPLSADVESSSSSTMAVFKCHPRQLFKLDQVGGWPGKVTSPTGVSFLPDGNLIVAECENRLQVFDQTGHSVRIIGWGKIRPSSVCVSGEGHIAITDRKDRCVKVYQLDGECLASWGTGFFSCPSGIAVMSNNNYVVSDVDRHSISIHSADGNVLSQFGSWGSEDYQFNCPSHLSVDHQDNIVVSDSGNSCVKIYDKSGLFQRKISLMSGKQGQMRRPQGVAVDSQGHVFISDRDNHRVTVFSHEGHFMCHLLNKNDAIRFPADLAVDSKGLLAIVETHTGFLTKDPHHAVKLYQLTSG